MKDLVRKTFKFINKYWFQTLTCLLLFAFSAILVVLLLWALNSSLKDNIDFRENMLGLPKVFMWENYSTILKNFYVDVSKWVYVGADNYMVTERVTLFPKMIVNTLVYTIGGALVSAICPCITAYVVAKFDKWWISKVIYGTVIVTMIIPIVGTMPASVAISQALGIYDNLFGSLFLKFNFLGMYFLVFHSSYKMLAKDYTEAAYLDGASEWRVFFSIILPLVKNILGTIVLIKFIEFWNDYGTVLVYLPTHPTLAYGIYIMSTTNLTGLSTAPLRITGAMILFVPTMIIFVAFQKKLLGNLSTGGVKE